VTDPSGPSRDPDTEVARPDAAWRPDTVAVRGGTHRSDLDETAEALFLTSGFVYPSAEEAADSFAGDSDHYVYSRLRNPTTAMLEERLRHLEGAEAAWATASGMSAVFNALAATLRAGDRVVASRALFGSCFQVLDQLLPRWGITTTFVDGTDLTAWEQALASPTRAVFLETPSNPMQELVDLRSVSERAHAVGARVIVDNVFATPVLQRPLELGADVVVYSTTKHLDGHGRTLGGTILGPQTFMDEELKPLMQHTGPTLSPFNAWVVLNALPTLRLRVERQTATALTLARWLEDHPAVAAVRYPWLASHPQHDLARRQMAGGGSIVTLELEGGNERAFQVLNAFELIDISNNLGDARSLATHPATTTHHRIGPAVRATMGVGDGVIRLSIGLEDVADLQADLDRALSR